MSGELLEILARIAAHLGLPCAVGVMEQTPPPSSYLVATPLVDSLDVFADNLPGVQVEEVRLALFTNQNYLPLRDQLTRALIEAGLTITGRTYIGFEPDTGFHHYAIDIATHHPFATHD